MVRTTLGRAGPGCPRGAAAGRWGPAPRRAPPAMPARPRRRARRRGPGRPLPVATSKPSTLPPRSTGAYRCTPGGAGRGWPDPRWPNRARPRRTMVAPSSTATSKSSLMPMDSSARPRPPASSREGGEGRPGIAPRAGTVMSPSTDNPRARRPSTRAGASSGWHPPFGGSSGVHLHQHPAPGRRRAMASPGLGPVDRMPQGHHGGRGRAPCCAGGARRSASAGAKGRGRAPWPGAPAPGSHRDRDAGRRAPPRDRATSTPLVTATSRTLPSGRPARRAAAASRAAPPPRRSARHRLVAGGSSGCRGDEHGLQARSGRRAGGRSARASTTVHTPTSVISVTPASDKATRTAPGNVEGRTPGGRRCPTTSPQPRRRPGRGRRARTRSSTGGCRARPPPRAAPGRAPRTSATAASSTPAASPRQPAWTAPTTPGPTSATGAQSAVRMDEHGVGSVLDRGVRLGRGAAGRRARPHRPAIDVGAVDLMETDPRVRVRGPAAEAGADPRRFSATAAGSSPRL